MLPVLGLLALTSACSADSARDGAVPEASAAPASSNSSAARVIVTSGFGAELIVDSQVALTDNMTAIEALQSVADVGTAYGGGFVQSIQGIGEGRTSRTDWFYAINGVLADRGSTDVTLHDGDLEHWDFRQWGFRRNVSATLGCFPAFFSHGFGGSVRPTVVAYETGYEAESASILNALEKRGITSVSRVEVSSLSEEWQRECNLIIIAGAEDALVRDVYKIWDRVGLFTRLDQDGLSVFTASGEEEVMGDDVVGVLQPLQNPWNAGGIGACESVVLLVSGTGPGGVRSAADALVESGDLMSTWCGAVVRGGVVLQVPLRTA